MTFNAGWAAMLATLLALLGGSTAASASGKGEASMTAERGASDLPYARGKSFASLDDYLAHRKRLGAMDIPYYEERKDGTYVYIAGRIRPGPDDVFTREELAERFGFPE